MFDSIKRLFGEGNIYFEFECSDGSVGRGKSPYIGDPSTFDRAEYERKIKDDIWFKHGKTVTQVNNIRMS